MLRRDARTTRWLRLLWPIGLAVLAAGCDNDDGTGPSSSPNAPIISNLRVSYNPGNPTVGTLTQVTFLVDVADPEIREDLLRAVERARALRAALKKLGKN